MTKMSEMSTPVPETLIEDIHYHMTCYDNAKSLANAGYHLIELMNKVSDLTTYHSGYMYENGTMPWQRDDEG
jgi:hypothetical protein